MNIKITSRKFKAKDSLKNFIKREINSLKKFNDNIMDANVVLSYTHLKDSIKSVEMVIQIPGKTITVTDSSEEFEKSVSSAITKVIRQLDKVKTKRIARKKA